MLDRHCFCFISDWLQVNRGTELESLSKVDKSGMKSISSFFGGGAKKTKKK